MNAHGTSTDQGDIARCNHCADFELQADQFIKKLFWPYVRRLRCNENMVKYRDDATSAIGATLNLVELDSACGDLDYIVTEMRSVET